jgi:hypothetical protein
MPMKLPPTLTARAPAAAASRMRVESSIVRSVKIPGRSRARRVQRARGRAGGQQQLAVAERLAAVELDALLVRQDAGRGALEQQLDLLLGVEALRLDERPVAVGLAS